MGNCQAIDAESIVIQHQCGKLEKLYSPVNAIHLMRTNPGHHVALLISSTTTISECNPSPRLTRIKLLRPSDSLVLGRVYRLITTQEVMKGLWAKKYAKMKKYQSAGESTDNSGGIKLKVDTLPKNIQVTKHDGNGQKAAANSGTVRSRTWQPSLHSISEAAS